MKTPFTTHASFSEVMEDTKASFLSHSIEVHPDRWQAVDVRNRPDFLSFELVNYHICVPLGHENLELYKDDIKPNLPWADDHFDERVCGKPINPGVQWANWPWGKSAAKHRNPDAQFNHNYMERFWPKFAGMTANGELPILNLSEDDKAPQPHRGIRNEYGDLDDVVDLLLRDPLTRQAYLPMFFPEDTGWGDGGRKPCTLGYQFMLRNGKLHIYYPMRSCDFVRHFRDDIYMAIRLGIWVLEQLRLRDTTGYWKDIKMGTYFMHCMSLHIFYNDWIGIFGKKPTLNLESMM